MSAWRVIRMGKWCCREDALSGWHGSYRPVAAGIHAATGCAGFPAKAQPHSFPWRAASNAKLRSGIIPGSKKNKSNPSDTNDAVPHSLASVRISWGRLFKRVFEIDIEHCPHCGGNMKIIAAILERAAITKILNHPVCLPGPPRLSAKAQGLFDPT